MKHSELMPFIRIGLYLLGAWFAARGVPAPVVEVITTDPGLAATVTEVAGQILGAVIVGVSVIWWRLAKRLGWAT